MRHGMTYPNIDNILFYFFQTNIWKRISFILSMILDRTQGTSFYIFPSHIHIDANSNRVQMENALQYNVGEKKFEQLIQSKETKSEMK